MAAQLCPPPILRFVDDNGLPLAGGQLFTYAAGTSTPQATYTDSTAGTQNANPVILDANGQCEVWLSALAYKFVLQDVSNVVQWTVDNISYINPASLTLSMFPTPLFTADTAGRAPFAASFVNTALIAAGALANTTGGRGIMAPGYFSADTLGRALMAAGFFSADATGQGKFASGFLTADTGGRALMANGYITQAKRAALGQQLSASCSSYSSDSSVDAFITNLYVNITTTGRPVTIALIPDGTASDSGIEVTGTGFGDISTYGIGNISFWRSTTANAVGPSGTGVAKFFNQTFTCEVASVLTLSGGITGTAANTTLYQVPASSFITFDVPAAGSYCYSVTGRTFDNVDTLKVPNLKLIAFEN